jgi:dinuclear metal center YbgI/SA1388 family protein
MPTLSSIVRFLDITLDTRSFNDASVNGLQVDSGKTEIRTVAVAVDSGLSILQAAINQSADLLIVHHGLFWAGGNHLATTLFGTKLRTLIEGGCSLYASHLPLDGHIVYGNAAQLATHLNLIDVEPFFQYQGSSIGVRTKCAQVRSMEEYIQATLDLPGVVHPATALAFGSKEIRSVGIVTGSGASAIEAAKQANLDLLISGEGKQEAYHTAYDLGMNVLFLGHYATETLGVRALGTLLEQEFQVTSSFLHHPTGF